MVEQYYQRPSLLQAFGWRVMNVYAKDWLEDEARVLLQIINAIERKQEDLVVAKEGLPSPKEQEQKERSITMLHSLDGERFWELDQQGHQLSIRFGRVGTKGHVSIKTFNSDEEANLSKEELIKHQLETGFRLT